MPGTPMPFVKPQFFTNAGVPAAGYQLFVYDAGTANKQNTWSDESLSSLNTNPIVLDSAGRASIFLTTQTHKFILATPTAADPPAGGDQVWSMDDVASLPYYTVGPAVNRAGTEVAWTVDDTVLTLTAPPSPVIASNYYVNNGTGTTTIDIPAGTLHNGTSILASLICEWETDYSAADLYARATMFGSNEDLGVGAGDGVGGTLDSENCRARYVVHPVTNTDVSVSQTVLQQTDVPAGAKAQIALAHTTIGSLNLATTGYTIVLGMASGTWTIRGARVFVLRNQTSLLG